MDDITSLQHFQAAAHSVTLIATLAAKTPLSAEEVSSIKANGQHLQTMIAKSVFTSEQIAALQVGVTQAQTFVDLGEAPPVTVPASVSMRQARLALLGAGLLDTVEAAIAGAGPAAKIEWEYAQEVQRASGLVPSLATALGMTSAQIDALFVAAAAL